ncbi:MAG: hypothetical protein HYV05_02830, partial [Deltaproteobacteria bacterium]|nr:hypothetical protein [Deltaproteobacteria bacterium]
MEAIAQRQGLAGWQKLMLAGFGLWIVATFGERLGFGENGIFLAVEGAVAFLQLITGIFILQGACEALVQSVERLGARLRWDGYVAGTMGEIVSTLPEFVVITFVVYTEPLAAFII